MSLENTTAKYEIQITKTGSGAVDAVREFAQVSQAAQSSSSALVRTGGSYHELHLATKVSTASLHEFHNISLLIGSQVAPQLTIAIQAAASGLHAVRAAAIASGAGLTITTAALAGVAAILWSATAAWGAYKAKQEEAASSKRLIEQQKELAARLRATIEDLADIGKITAEEADALYAKLDTNLKSVIGRLREITGNKDELEAVAKLDELRGKLTEKTLDGYARERFAAHQNYLEERQAIDDLAKKGGSQVSGQTRAETQQLALDAFNAETRRLDTKLLEEESSKNLIEFEKDLTIASLTDSHTREQQAEHEFDLRLRRYKDLFDAGKITEERLTELTKDASIKRLEAIKKEKDQTTLLEESAAKEFSSGFAHAFVEFASGTKSAQDAFRDFAVSFLQKVAEMIIETQVLAVIKSVAGLGGGGIRLAGAGGMFPTFAASGLAGVSSVSRPTYFPKFNVVAGEAGREMLTVLARPKFMELGGIEAVVGQAGPHQLAITRAADLAGGPGAGGKIQIEISHSEDAKARIIDDSIQGAVVTITKQVQQHSRLREAIKKVGPR